MFYLPIILSDQSIDPTAEVLLYTVLVFFNIFLKLLNKYLKHYKLNINKYIPRLTFLPAINKMLFLFCPECNYVHVAFASFTAILSSLSNYLRQLVKYMSLYDSKPKLSEETEKDKSIILVN